MVTGVNICRNVNIKVFRMFKLKVKEKCLRVLSYILSVNVKR